MLQCDAVCCSSGDVWDACSLCVAAGVAAGGSLSPCVTVAKVHGTPSLCVLQCAAVCYSMLQCVAVCCRSKDTCEA